MPRLQNVLLLLTVIFIQSLSALPAFAQNQPLKCPIVPQPKEFAENGEIWILGNGTDAAILENSACPYAQERLQALIQNRFHRTLPILPENEISAQVTQIFRLQINENDGSDTKTLPFNGFEITFQKKGTENENRQEICVSGADLSGVIFGVEALFNLLKKSDSSENVELLCATVRDWPSIPWRGRPHSVAAHHLEAGQLDAYMHARLNFSDFRDAPNVPETLTMPARKASMGCAPGKPIDREVFNRLFQEFKRRGMFVYGTVSCQIAEEQYTALAATFDELRTLGCDGIWVSMDDTGGGKDPVKLAQFVADYMKSRNISGHEMVFTPGGAEYTTIDRPLNRAMAQIDGFNDGYWIFTRVPSAADLALCQEIGLKNKPCWWFNYCETSYPDPKAGFIHSSSILTTQRKDGRPGYMNLLPITPGWGAPEFDRIRDAAKYTNQVNLWALCGGWPSEYALVMFGNWAWAPETCDWPTLRDSIYDFVWGPGQIAVIREFDELYAELKTLYWMPENWRFRAPNNSLVRLKTPENRERALQILDRLDALAQRLAADAPKETALTSERLHDAYLEPMQTTLRFARLQAALEYPEYSYEKFEADLETLEKTQGFEAAQRRFQDEIQPQLSQILTVLSSKLAELKDIEPVLDRWRERLQKSELKYGEKTSKD